MMQYDGQELVTLLWSLAQLHHQPGPEWLDIFCEAAQPQLPSMNGNQLSQLLWAFAQLRWTPPVPFLESHLSAVSCRAAKTLVVAGCRSFHVKNIKFSLPCNHMSVLHRLCSCIHPGSHLPPFCSACAAKLAWCFLQCQTLLSTDEMSTRDAASLLASLSELQHTPQEPWLHACLNLLYWRLRELDPEGLATVPISLAKLNVIVSNGPFLDSYISMTTPRLSGMSAETQVQLLSALAVFGAELPRAWVAAFQLMMVQQAEAGGVTTAQMEQVRLLLFKCAVMRNCACCCIEEANGVFVLAANGSTA
jgi:hypothetical protein